MRVQRWKETETEQMTPAIGRKVIHTANMTMAQLYLKKGAVVPEHHHINEQISTVLQGRLLFVVAGVDQVVSEGESIVLPPNVPHRVDALEDSVALDVFAPVREDWVKGDDAYLRSK